MKNIFDRSYYPYITLNKTDRQKISNISTAILNIQDARKNLFDEIIQHDALTYNFVSVDCEDEQITDWISDDDTFGFEYVKNDVKYHILAMIDPFEYRLFVDDETKEIINYYDVTRADNLKLINCICYRALVRTTQHENVGYAIANVYFHANRYDDITSSVFHVEVDTNTGNCNDISRLYHRFIHDDNRVINGIILENKYQKKTSTQPIIKIVDTKYQRLSLVRDYNLGQYYFVYEEPEYISCNRIAKPFWTSTKDNPSLTKQIWDVIFNSNTTTVKSEHAFDDGITTGTIMNTYILTSDGHIACQMSISIGDVCYILTEIKGSTKTVKTNGFDILERVRLKTIHTQKVDSKCPVFEMCYKLDEIGREYMVVSYNGRLKE